MTAPDDTPADGICARCGRDHELDAVVNEHISELLENEPADDIPTTDPYTGQDMRFGGDRAGSLEAILNKYASEYRAWMNLKSDEKPGLQEALAAIAAYYEGLIPEKHGTTSYDYWQGHDDAIDTIRRNFKGDSNG